MPNELFDAPWQYKTDEGRQAVMRVRSAYITQRNKMLHVCIPGWCLDADISLSAEPAEAVKQLYVVSRNTHCHVSGIYSLLPGRRERPSWSIEGACLVYVRLKGQTVNDQPLWKREGSGEELWLYGGTDGKWHASCLAERRAALECP